MTQATRSGTYLGASLVLCAILSASLPAPLFAQVPVASAATQPLALLPQPREIAPTGTLPLTHGVVVNLLAATSDANDAFAAQDLREAFTTRRITPASPSSSALQIDLLRANTPLASARMDAAHLAFDPAMAAEGYVIVSGHNRLTAIAASSEGLFYACQTIKQLIAGTGAAATLTTANVRDWPAMRWRGLDDDLSRGPIPTLDFQKHQLRTLAAFKVNVYSPYFENTFAYTATPLAAPPGGALTRADAEELVRYARQYHITIIPEQEAFGHLDNVLSWDRYAPLAETPHGHVLAPADPAAIPLIGQWFTELAEVFPGPFLHMGADEPFDLGLGKTKADVATRGLGAVYLDFLRQVHDTLQPLHRRILFWGDVAVNEPALVKTLPKDLIAVPWYYNPDPKGFDHLILPFKQAGLETWVAPGVNNWNRVYPDNNLALGNIQGFIRDGQRLGSTGVLTTVWNDDGEGLFAQDWYGVLFGAAAAWQAGESSIDQYNRAYGSVFHGDTTGKLVAAQQELMAAHALLRTAGLESASDNLFWLDPWSRQGQLAAAKIRPIARELRLHAEQALILLAGARAAAPLRELDAITAIELGARRIDLIGYKFETADEIVVAYDRAWNARLDPRQADVVERELDNITGTNGHCQDLRNAYSLLRALYEQAWLRENKPFWLGNVLVRYDVRVALWSVRGDRFADALSQWASDKTLPAPAELGIAPPAPSATGPATEKGQGHGG